MKNQRRLTAATRKLALPIGLLVGLALPVWGNVFLYENFDGPVAPMGGWAGNAGQVLDPSYAYVNGVGVDATIAMQESVTFLDFGGYIGMLYQNPTITGNVGATRANTMMAFDLKVNVPDIYGFAVGVQSWQGDWSGIPTASILDWFTLPDPLPENGPPWPDYDLPQEFQTFIVSLADPRWYVDPNSPSWQGQFNPAGAIYQVWFGMGGGYSLPLYFDQTRLESLTVDNVRFWTVIDGLAATPAVLWSPNHKMVDVAVEYTLSDGDGVAPIISSELSVTSNEPINGLGDGDTSPDWEVVDAHHVRLRAERSGTGKGRVYTITLTCIDSLGNASTKAVTVAVPKSQAR